VGRLRARDPRTGQRVGPLPLDEAVAAGRASVGRHTYGNPTFLVWPAQGSRLRIGAFCSLASGVTFYGGDVHRMDWVTTFPFRVRWGVEGAYEDGHPKAVPDTIVGNDVWIGADAAILPGVRIGDGAVIGAHAVVARDVRPYAIVVGNPAHEVRRRFDDAMVDHLLRTAWWDWPDDVIEERLHELCSGDIEGFVARYGA
jgi:acetyltransferase-like isoleucine patch superfamily enzyme